MENAKQLAGMSEVSARLAQKLAAPGEHAMQTVRLAVRIGTRSFLLDMASVGEVVPLSALTPVPWTRPWFRGLANVRGRLVGVYDVRQMNGEEPLRDDQAQQLLVLAESLKVSAALLITRAFGLRYARDLEPVAGQPAEAAWDGGRFVDGSGMDLTLLDLARLVADERFVSVGI